MDRALTLKPDYREALIYKNLLLRSQATVDPTLRVNRRSFARPMSYARGRGNWLAEPNGSPRLLGCLQGTIAAHGVARQSR